MSSSSSSSSEVRLPLPSTYRAAVIPAAGSKFEIRSLPLPTPGPGEVLVQVKACGSCHSDSFTVGGTPLFQINYPRVPGHEVAGLVAAVGPGVKRWKVGDRVGRGWHGDHCFECNPCLHGDFLSCQLHAITGITRDGGFAEYMIAPWQSLASIPDNSPFEEAGPLLCAGLTVFNSIRHQHLFPGALVAVQGIGGLGHLAVQFAAANGYKVVAISTSQSKKELALKLGAHIYLDTSTQNVVQELNKLGGAQLIVATAYSSKAQSDLVPGLATGGTLLVLGAGSEPLQAHPGLLIGKQAKIAGWASGSPIDAEETMQFADFKKVKTQVEVFPLDQAQKAYDRMMSNDARFRVVVKP